MLWNRGLADLVFLVVKAEKWKPAQMSKHDDPFDVCITGCQWYYRLLGVGGTHLGCEGGGGEGEGSRNEQDL